MNRLALVTKFTADEAGTIKGIAWPFGSPDRYGDTIERGAFRSAAGRKLPMLYAHDQGAAVGVWETVEERADGLHVTGRLLVEDVTKAREVRALVQAGAITGLSVGFRPKKSTARPSGGRSYSDVELLEVSIVPVPAHQSARVTAAKHYTPAGLVAAAFNRAAAAFR